MKIKHLLTAMAATLALAAMIQTASAAGLASPTLTCINPTATSITVQMCAGSTGARAGFSLHWITKADYTTAALAAGYANAATAELAGFWPGTGFCKVSMSGNAAGTRWDLTGGECRDFTIGYANGQDFDPGVSYTCDVTDALVCNTTYVLRAFAHNVPSNKGGEKKSDFSAIIECTTAACGGGNEECTDVCTFGQGAFLASGNDHTAANTAIANAGGFAALFPSGLVVGGTPKSLTFNSLAAVQAYPIGGNPDPLASTQVYPGGVIPTGSAKNGFASQTIAFTLNLAINPDCALLATIDNFDVGNQALGGSALTLTQVGEMNGKTFAQVLAAANGVLGGNIAAGSQGALYLTVGQLSQLVDFLNLSFNGCVPSAFALVHVVGITPED